MMEFITRGWPARNKRRYVVKTIREVIEAILPQACRPHASAWFKPLLALALCLAAGSAHAAAPLNNNFANAFTLSGLAGSTNGDNTSATLETPCEALQVNCDD